MQNDNMLLWIALFALAGVSILILFLSSRQTSKLASLHQALLDKQQKMETNQNMLLTTMSENIHDIAVKTLEEGRQVLNTPATTIEKKEEMFSNVENRLLDVTNDLISYLRLKSSKIEIVNEEFNINNVLNEVSGAICTKFSGSNSELIFDIDKNVPRHLVGDSLHLGKILESILEYQMNQTDICEVKLEISMFDTHGDMIEMQFIVTDTGEGLHDEEISKLFKPYYDETLGAYVGLGLFVANELITLMNGSIDVQSTLGKGNTFTLAIPLNVVDKANKRKYRLPQKDLIEKKVFIVDDNYNASLAIKKMFAYFRHEVTLLSECEFNREKPDLAMFDIIVLNQSLFELELVNTLIKIKRKKDIKIIALNSLLRENKGTFVGDIIDLYLFKPLNQERIFELIINLYIEKDKKVDSNLRDKDNTAQKSLLTHKVNITETKDITQESFKKFKGKHLLIVEDNLINQKVLINVLHLSDMKISVANNGQEAVDMVKEGTIAFDFVLMDINMPIMDGYTATQMIRLDPHFDTLPIVSFTALVLDSEVKKMFNAGINAFLSKPLNIGKLYTVFMMYLSDTSEIPIPSERIAPKRIFKQYNGIDIEVGIKHSSNSEALYIEVLKEFSEAYGQSNQVFSTLVAEHRYAQIKMLCVDMRGITGAIGANDMSVLSTEILQLILYKKETLLANYTEAYSFELEKLIKAIDGYLLDV